eukprot:TRINITY_DN75261_c0_g1_i1.p1 TRINITY_DN75261_c0_g1~~TRINITY_DN75261_c0_g1_i1.p1  ORF type:complete len:367 (+),score=48.29 TRINITY_DN75261_c0_g1_i1:73-1101(+)
MEEDDSALEYLAEKRKQVAAMQEAAAMAQQQTLAIMQLQQRVAEIDALAYGPSDDAPSKQEFRGGAFEPSRPNGRKPAGRPPSTSGSSLSLEDRRRFGLSDSRDDASDAIFESSRQCHGSEASKPRVWWPQSEVETCPSPRGPSPSPRGQKTSDSACGNAQGSSATTIPMSASPRDATSRNKPSWSSLSDEDRRRFGLDDPAPSTPSLARAPSTPSTYSKPSALKHSPQKAASMSDLSDHFMTDDQGFQFSPRQRGTFSPRQRGTDPRLPVVSEWTPKASNFLMKEDGFEKPTKMDLPASTAGISGGMARTLSLLHAAGTSAERLKALEQSERQLALLRGER